MAPPDASANSNLDGDWSVVSRRRGRRNRPPKPHPQTLTPTLTLDPPSPWSPSDLSTDPDRESRILKRIQSSIHHLDASRFYRRFFSRLQSPQIQLALARILAPDRKIQIVVYGIGSIESYNPPRLQLALAVLLRRDLGVAVSSVEVFDPVLSASECTVLESLGCTVIRRDERGRREAAAPTLFYLPHCEVGLYDNLLDANWRPEALSRMVVLGNSFGMYEQCVGTAGGGTWSESARVAARHVLGVRKYTREVEMEERKADRGSEEEHDDGEHVKIDNGNKDDEGFYRAFHDMSWHFFEFEDVADMNLLME